MIDTDKLINYINNINDNLITNKLEKLLLEEQINTKNTSYKKDNINNVSNNEYKKPIKRGKWSHINYDDYRWWE